MSKNRGKPKTIFRVAKVNNYKPIHRYSAEDKRLSWEARGVLIFLLVKPDDWQVCLSHLIKNSPAGRDKVRRIINELRQFNYIVKKENRGKHGQFSAPEYIVYELPNDGFFDSKLQGKPEKAATAEPTYDKPPSSNPPLLSKQTELSKQLTNKTTTNSFIWSPKLSHKQQESILSLIDGIEKESAQLLLDELTGQIDFIKNPVGYFRSLLQSHFAGNFIPAKALHVQATRAAKQANEQAVQKSLKVAEEQLQLQINKYSGELT